MARVLLVMPPETTSMGTYVAAPLGLLYIASTLLVQGHQVQVADGAVEGEAYIEERLHARWDLVGVSCLTPNRHRGLKILRRAKELGSRTVMGGVHPSLLPEQILENYPFVDYVVTGPGEIGIRWLLDQGLPVERQIVKAGLDGIDLDSLPFPAWELVNWRDYTRGGQGLINGIDTDTSPRIPIIMSRGCRGACTFCSTFRVWKGYTTRLGKKVADEVEYLYRMGARHFHFKDDMMTGDREQIVDLCHEIRRRGLQIAWFATTRADMVDLELLRLMASTGCYQLSFGFESGSERMLKLINKRSDLSAALQATDWCRQVGIRVVALMMHGLPGETEDDRRATERFLAEIKPDSIGSVGKVWVFPATALFHQCKKRGHLDDDFWLGPEPCWMYEENPAPPPALAEGLAGVKQALAEGKNAEALSALEYLRLAHPGHGILYLLLCRIALMTGELEIPVRWVSRAVELDAGLASEFDQLARRLEAQGRRFPALTIRIGLEKARVMV